MSSKKIEDMGEHIPKPSWILKLGQKKFINGEYDNKLPALNLSSLKKNGISKETAFAVFYIKDMATKKKNRNSNPYRNREKAHDLIVSLLLANDDDPVIVSDFIAHLDEFYSGGQFNFSKETLPLHLIEDVDYECLDLLSSSRQYPECYSKGASLLEFKVGRKMQKSIVEAGEDIDSSLIDIINDLNSKRKIPKKRKEVDMNRFPPLYSEASLNGGDEIDLKFKIKKGKFLTLMTFPSRKELRKYLAEKNEDGGYLHAPDVWKILKEKQSLPSFRNKISLPRTGEEYRQNRNISPENFHDIFPFRAIQFGNYVGDSLRQENLNKAFDALNDMCLALNINRNCLIKPTGEKENTFSIAFGARGRGGRTKSGMAFSAHFEPDEFIINLTKQTPTNSGGAGSLCHEMMGHGLDYALGMKSGRYLSEAFADKELIRELTENPEKDPNFPLGKPDSENMQKVIISVGKIMKFLGGSDVSKFCAEKDSANSGEYYNTPAELFARGMEAFVKYELENTHNIQNDYLVSIAEDSELFLKGKELEATIPLFREIFSSLNAYRVEVGLDKKSEVGFSKPILPSNTAEDVPDDFELTPLKKSSKKRSMKQLSLF